MKLAIFGDSYASKIQDDLTLEGLPCWPDLVARQDISVDNYACSGTSFWYSYQKFLEHHQGYDRVVFLATAYHRQSIRSVPQVSTVNPEHLDWHMQHGGHSRTQIAAIKASRENLIWSQDLEYNWHCQALMIRDLQQQRPDILIIPCFETRHSWEEQVGWHGGSPSIPGWEGLNLWQISEIDHQYFGIDISKIQVDRRHCHMNEGNNQIFAAEIARWIKLGHQPLRDLSFYQPPRRSLDFYFKMET